MCDASLKYKVRVDTIWKTRELFKISRSQMHANRKCIYENVIILILLNPFNTSSQLIVEI